MSFTLYPPRKQSLQRSYLAVPGSNPTMIDRAIKSAADYVFLDCEDAVAPPEKEQARKNIIQALNDLDWKGAGKSVSRPHQRPRHALHVSRCRRHRGAGRCHSSIRS